MASAISVREGAGAAYGFLRPAWRASSGALTLSALTATAFVYADAARLGAGPILLSLAAQTLAGIIALGGLFRVALARDGGTAPAGLGPLGLQWGAVEGRLLGMTLLMALLFAIIGLVLVIVVAAVIIGLSIVTGVPFDPRGPDWFRALGPAGMIVFLVTVLAAYGFVIWIALRLSLASVATAASGRIQLLSTFDYTRGRVWRLAALAVITALPVILVSIVGGGMTPGGPGWGAGLVAIVSGLTIAFVHAPAAVGLLVYLYRRLAPSGAV